MNQVKKFQVNIDDYEKGEKLGKGAFATVYKCTKTDTEEVFALKEMLISETDEFRKEYFNREITIMSRINHPTLIRFHGFAINENRHMLTLSIIMDLSKKGSLDKALAKKGYFDNTAKQKLLVGIARGMMYLHKRGIIFRDLKVQNILLNDDNHPIISDFGLAKIITKNDLIQTQKAGTFLTMAPEVMTSTKYTGKADVYSFAMVMYQIVTGRTPFDTFLKENPKISPYQFITAVQKQTRPSFEGTKIKDSIKDLIERCWSHLEADRPKFDEIFYMLAYNHGDDIYDDLFSNDEENYYLDDVDQEEVVAYADSIRNDNNVNETFNTTIEDLKSQISSMKNHNDKVHKTLTDENKKLRKEKDRLVKEREDMEERLSKLEKGTEKAHKKSDPIHNDDDDEKPLKIVCPRIKGRTSKEFVYKKGQEFNGILFDLTKKVKGNVCDKGKVLITSKSTHQLDDEDNESQFQPRNVVEYDDNTSGFLTNDQPGAFLLFDFKNSEVKISGYSIKSNSKKGSTANLRKWNVDVSNDKTEWQTIDQQENSNALNGQNKVAYFEVNKTVDGYYRYVKITSKGKSFYNKNNHYMFFINMVEFFGRIRDKR